MQIFNRLRFCLVAADGTPIAFPTVLMFFLVTQDTSLVVRVAISAFGEYFCRIRNHVDKYVITKQYYQLMPLSLVTYATPGGYASGNFLKIRNFLKFSPRRRLRLCPRANKNLHITA
ncbi:hypothetical protein T09_14672, partial [Trichinella sp. T9]